TVPALHARGQTVPTPLRSTTDERLVHLDLATERSVVLREQRTNLLEHAPRRLVRDAEFAFELLRGDSASSARHEIDRVEPQAQGRSRVLEDRPRHWVEIRAAELALVGGR